jgi:hypothetical protein
MRAIDDAVGTEGGDRLLNGRGRFVPLVSISERPPGSAASVEATAVNRPRGRGVERARLRGTSGAVAAACDAGSGRSRSVCTQEEGRLSSERTRRRRQDADASRTLADSFSSAGIPLGPPVACCDWPKLSAIACLRSSSSSVSMWMKSDPLPSARLSARARSMSTASRAAAETDCSQKERQGSVSGSSRSATEQEETHVRGPLLRLPLRQIPRPALALAFALAALELP